MTDPQQPTISATWNQAEDGSYTASVRVSGIASEAQAKSDLQRMRGALSERQQDLPPQFDEQAERETFEKWAQTQHMRVERWDVNPELYDDEDAISAWQGWEARALAASAPSREVPDQEAADDAATMDRMSDLLTRTANALRGDPGPLRRWSWHDLPERAAAAIDVMTRAAQKLASEPGVKVPEGWKLVPIEPTLEMVEAGRIKFTTKSDARYRWGQMIAAAPSTPVAAEETKK